MPETFLRRKLSYFFRILDLNNNGFLQLDDLMEMVNALRKALKLEENGKVHKRVKEKAGKLFKTLARDIKPTAFNQITEEEWILFFEKELSTSDDEAVDFYKEMIFNFMFDFFDQNRDGYISREEYLFFFKTFGIDTRFFEETFDKLDTSKLGRMSRYDLMNHVEEFLVSTDERDEGNWIFGNWKSEPRMVNESK